MVAKRVTAPPLIDPRLLQHAFRHVMSPLFSEPEARARFKALRQVASTDQPHLRQVVRKTQAGYVVA